MKNLSWLLIISALGCLCARADIVTLEDNQGDYTFQGTNTYYITNGIFVWGTATFEAGTVIKYGPYGGLDLQNPPYCQTTPDAPAIFTSCDDDRFGEVLPDS